MAVAEMVSANIGKAGEAVILELKIREATEADIPRVLDMGRSFLLNGPLRQFVKDNPERVKQTAARILSSPRAKVLVCEEEDGRVTGVFAFVVFEHYFSGETTAGELLWFVEPDSRKGGIGLKLLAAAEDAARALGATHMQMTAPSHAMADLYRRCGYTEVETNFQRKL